jgi:demethylmenaquinone methyltransferase/2-methoxy-6-polyprenyl-1,4-benzoquinol methylase
MDDQIAKPLKTKTEINCMFDSIARRYDLLNHLLSFGIDRSWRRKAVGKIPGSLRDPIIIDVATGTGDLAIEAAGIFPGRITGIDISEKMLEIGRQKIKARGLENVIELIRSDSENLCFADGTFDVAMVAFGVRNFNDPVKGLSEMTRVVKVNGIVIVLEFSKPDGLLFKHFYNIYFKDLLPFAGALFSRDLKAYKYLNQSVMNFADKEKFILMMHEAGLSEIKQTRMTGGIATIYTGVKK